MIPSQLEQEGIWARGKEERGKRKREFCSEPKKKRTVRDGQHVSLLFSCFFVCAPFHLHVSLSCSQFFIRRKFLYHPSTLFHLSVHSHAGEIGKSLYKVDFEIFFSSQKRPPFFFASTSSSSSSSSFPPPGEKFSFFFGCLSENTAGLCC